VFTSAAVAGFYATNPTKGAGSTIGSAMGVYVEDITVGTNNYGFLSLISSGSNKYNIYASGTASNYLAGGLNVGATSDPGAGNLSVTGSVSAASLALTTTPLPVSSGGTGLTTIPTNGQLLIGNGTSYALNTLSAGTNISIVNASGTITISSTGGGSSGSGNAYAWFIST
jgi:hypothetical protein